MCPQKLKTFWLTVSWNPLVNARVTIITATLMTVAPIESRIMNREKDRWRLNAIRFAIKLATFNGNIESFKNVNKNKINIGLFTGDCETSNVKCDSDLVSLFTLS